MNFRCEISIINWYLEQLIDCRLSFAGLSRERGYSGIFDTRYIEAD